MGSANASLRPGLHGPDTEAEPSVQEVVAAALDQSMRHYPPSTRRIRTFNAANDVLNALRVTKGIDLRQPPHQNCGEELLEFKEALSDLRDLRSEHRDLNGGGPGWSTRWEAAWAKADDLFADEDEAAWERAQEGMHGG
jgi:hypothetical protein